MECRGWEEGGSQGHLLLTRDPFPQEGDGGHSCLESQRQVSPHPKDRNWRDQIPRSAPSHGSSLNLSPRSANLSSVWQEGGKKDGRVGGREGERKRKEMCIRRDDFNVSPSLVILTIITGEASKKEKPHLKVCMKSRVRILSTSHSLDLCHLENVKDIQILWV